MPVRSKSKNRCESCYLYQPLCVCPETGEARATLLGLGVETRVILLVHMRETRLTTNSARLASLALPGAEFRVRGERGQVLQTEGLVTEARQSLFLFPSEDAQVLTSQFLANLKKPVTLIVPDGSWSQARKVGNRVPALEGVPRVKLPPGPLSQYRLRREPQPEFLSTYEAVARAVQLLETARGKNGTEIQRILDRVFLTFVERILWSRGQLSAENSVTEIPKLAFQMAYEAGCRG